MTITTRPFIQDDYKQWHKLWQGYLAYYKSAIAPEITAATWARLLDPSSGVEGFCAVNAEGALVGIVHYLFHPVTWATGPRCYLEDLFTDKQARGFGAGRALIEAVSEAAKAANADQVYWLTEDYNKRAHYLYDKVATKTPFIKYMKTL